METNWLSDFSMTLAVGLMAMCVAGLVFWHWPFEGVRHWIRVVCLSWTRDAEAPRTLAAPIAALLAFGLGLFFITVSDWAQRDWKLSWVFATEDSIRARALAKPRDGSLKLTALGREMANAGLFSRLGGVDPAVEERLRADGAIPKDLEPSFEDVSSVVYFHCKNAVMNKDGAGRELGRTQMTIDFTRGTLLIVCLGAACAVLGLIAGIAGLARIKGDKSLTRERRVRLGNLSFILVGLIGVGYVVKAMFEGLEREYDKLAYGNYATLFKEGEMHPAGPQQDPAARAERRPPVLPAVSGAAALGDGKLLVVHDAKGSSGDAAKKPRFGIVSLSREGGASYVALELHRWDAPLPNDLESVARWPGSLDEFVTAESSHYEGKGTGRMFRVRLREGKEGARSVELLGVALLPDALTARNPAAKEPYDQIEGLACDALADGRVRVVLGERKSGKIIACEPDWPKGVCEDRGVVVDAQAKAMMPGVGRQISDLLIARDGQGRELLWAVGVDDPEDGGRDGALGPFRSVVYAAAERVDGGWRRLENIEARWTLDGLKVEALALCCDPNQFVAGTDDEAFEGVVRVLPGAP